MGAKSSTDAELLAAALQSAQKLAEQMKVEQAAMASRGDRGEWLDGEHCASRVQQAMESLAEQINSNPL